MTEPWAVALWAAIPEEAAQRKRQHKATEDNHRGMEVRVLHLLKKHRGSRRPASWRCDKITITKDEASRLVSELRDQVVAAGEEGKRAKFEELARVESDCGSAHRGAYGSANGKQEALIETPVGAPIEAQPKPPPN